MNVKYKETSEIGDDEPNSSKKSRGPSKHVLEDSMDNTSISKHLKKKKYESSAYSSERRIMQIKIGKKIEYQKKMKGSLTNPS